MCTPAQSRRPLRLVTSSLARLVVGLHLVPTAAAATSSGLTRNRQGAVAPRECPFRVLVVRKGRGGSVDALPLERCELPVRAVLQRELAGGDRALIAAMSG
jgi:hypothetical protein